MSTKAYLTNYYQNYDEEGFDIRKGMVEYITTMKYIEKYQQGMRIMKFGVATGRYSHAFVQKGYQVYAKRRNF